MGFHLLPFHTILFIALLLCAIITNTHADTDFSCSQESPSSSSSSCQTFLTYRAQTPDYTNLDTIATLFGVNTSTITKASQLPPTNSLQLVHDQLILIPISCNCNGSYYFYDTTYTIKKDDSFYSVSIHAFQNLTDYHFVQDMNSQLNPLNLTIGSNISIPLLCKCPSQSMLQNGFQYIITYVWQPNDNLQSVASMFNTTSSSILEENDNKNFSKALCLPMKIPVQRPVIFQNTTPLAATNTTSSKTNHRSHFSTVLSITIALSSMLMIILGYYMYVMYKKKKAFLLRNSSSLTKMIAKSSKNQDKILPGVSGYLSNLVIYEIQEIIDGTEDFSEQNRIGGLVYKAKIKDQIFAVKKTKDGSQELTILQKFRHLNLIQLSGISSDNQENLFLVFEYADHGSLDKWLFEKSFLSWNQRLSIALDVANGLQYMHEHTQPSIVHRDISTKNILLDSNFKAKIGNFSMARGAENNGELKDDVFGFGVILLELISGKKSVEVVKNGEIKMLWKEIKRILENKENGREEEFRKWVDPRLKDVYEIESVFSLTTLATACTEEKACERPKMTDIVFNLCVLSQSCSEMNQRNVSKGDGEGDESLEVIIRKGSEGCVEGDESIEVIIPVAGR